jgi:hypothetical protein
MREHGGFERFDFIVIEQGHFDSRLDLDSRENDHRMQHNAQLNMQPSGVGLYGVPKKKYFKDHYARNKPAILIERAEYRVANARAIAKQKGTKITCECGTPITKGARSRHRKTPKHLKNMELKSMCAKMLDAIILSAFHKLYL